MMKNAIQEMLSPRHALVAGYITLSDIQLDGLPEAIPYKGINLVKKNEFHLTIISLDRIAASIDANNPDIIKAQIIEEFRKHTANNKVDQFKLLDQFRYVTRDTRKTIVVMCEFPDGKRFFEVLEKRFGKLLTRQPFHITIFSLEPEVGISLSSAKDLEATVQIYLPELKDVRKA